MASIEGMIGTSSAQIGQGTAYVLPESRSADYAIKLALDERNRILAQKAARAQQQAELQAQFREDLMAKEAPKFWSAFSQPVRGREQAWRQKALSQIAEGRDPFTNPDLQREWSDVQDVAAYSSELLKQITDTEAKILAKPDDYSARTKKELDEFKRRIISDPERAYREKMTPPSLSAKELGADDFVKRFEDIPEFTRIVGQERISGPDVERLRTGIAVELQLNSDEWQNMLQSEFDIQPDEIDFGFTRDVDGGIVYPTAGEDLQRVVRSAMRKPEVLQEFGINSNDPNSIEDLTDRIVERNQKYNNAVDLLTDRLTAGTDISITPDFTLEDQEMQRQRLAMERGRFGLAQRREARLAAGAQGTAENVIIGNANSFVPVEIKTKGGELMTDFRKGASLFSANLPTGSQSNITVNPSIVIPLEGENANKGQKNVASFTMKASGVKMVPVIKGARTGKDIELSLDQLDYIIQGKSKTKPPDISFELMVPGVRTVERQVMINGRETGETEKVQQPIQIPYDAVRGNKNFKATGVDQAYQEFGNIISHPEFKKLNATERLEFLKQYYNLE